MPIQIAALHFAAKHVLGLWGEAMTMAILCEPDQDVAAALAALIGDEVHTVASLPVAALALDAHPQSLLVVIGAGIDFDQALQFANARRRVSPDVAVILLRDQPSAVIKRAVEAGIHEVVRSGDSLALVDACDRFRSLAPAAATYRPTGELGGRVVTVFSAKGGCGKTTLATNLAVSLNREAGKRVCLVDLDLGFGDIASSLRLEPERTLADIESYGPKLDIRAAARVVTTYRPGLDCILAPVGPGEARRVPASTISELLTVLPAIYDYVVVDTSATFTAHVLAALDNSDHHVLITTPDFPTLKSLRVTLDTLDLLSYSQKSRFIVLNRADSRVGLTAADVDSVVKSPISAHVPSSWDVPASTNRGVPLAAAQPDHPVSVAFRRFADAYVIAAGASRGLGSNHRTGGRNGPL